MYVKGRLFTQEELWGNINNLVARETIINGGTEQQNFPSRFYLARLCSAGVTLA